jgi:ketosteroid isomerase-like protein
MRVEAVQSSAALSTAGFTVRCVKTGVPMRFQSRTGLLLLVLVVAVPRVSNAGETEERARILQVLAQIDQARVKGDLFAMRRFLTDDFAETDSDRTYSLAEVLESERKPGYKILSIERHDIRIAVQGGKATVDGRMVVNAQTNGGRVQSTYRATYEFVRLKGGWLLSKAAARLEKVIGRQQQTR